MDTELIEKCLEALNTKLEAVGERGEIFLLGGAVMCLRFNARTSTKDVDAIFVPKTEIYEYAKEIARDYNINDDWLNDAVKGFVNTLDGRELYKSMSALDIYTAKAEYLFAMKCIACRLEEGSKDLDDIKYLKEYLDLNSVDEAVEIILTYFPESMVLPKTSFMLQELFLS